MIGNGTFFSKLERCIAYCRDLKALQIVRGSESSVLSSTHTESQVCFRGTFLSCNDVGRDGRQLLRSCKFSTFDFVLRPICLLTSLKLQTETFRQGLSMSMTLLTCEQNLRSLPVTCRESAKLERALWRGRLTSGTDLHFRIRETDIAMITLLHDQSSLFLVGSLPIV